MRPAAKRQLEKDKEKGLKDMIRIALKKGTILSSKNGQKYEIVGSWYGDIVMSNIMAVLIIAMIVLKIKG